MNNIKRGAWGASGEEDSEERKRKISKEHIN